DYGLTKTTAIGASIDTQEESRHYATAGMMSPNTDAKISMVSPVELEALLLSHPEIVDVVVISFPDKEAGQLPIAYIVRKQGSPLFKASFIGFVAKQVAPHKKVRRVAFVSGIPKNASGKILRKDLIKLSTS
ncbi:hypothetical protein KI387_016660, partial [Taxus chinensis]